MALIKVKTGGVDSTTNLGRRNLVINGAMQVDQRGSTFTAPNGAYTLDRYSFYQANGAVFDVKKSTDAPVGFSGSLEIDCTTAAASPAANAYAQMATILEGQDLQGLAYGTSSAKKITLSFWVKSNKTGTYQVNFRPNDGSVYMASKTYTINSSNTWEYKSVTVDGATGFSLVTDNTRGLMIDWWYHSGTTYSSGSGSETYIALLGSNYNNGGTANLGDNTSNYLRMTGVQLEVGDTATPFEHRSYGEELSLCQRYYEKDNPYTPTSFGGSLRGFSYPPTNGSGIAQSRDGSFTSFAVEKRATPTITLYSYGGTSGNVSWITGGGNDTNVSSRAGTKGFQCSSSTYRNFHVWFAWTAEAEL